MENESNIFDHTTRNGSNIRIKIDQKSGEYIFTIHEKDQNSSSILLRLPRNTETHKPTNFILKWGPFAIGLASLIFKIYSHYASIEVNVYLDFVISTVIVMSIILLLNIFFKKNYYRLDCNRK